MPRMAVYLDDEIAASLRRVAHRERRRPNDQAAVLLERILREDCAPSLNPQTPPSRDGDAPHG